MEWLIFLKHLPRKILVETKSLEIFSVSDKSGKFAVDRAEEVFFLIYPSKIKVFPESNKIFGKFKKLPKKEYHSIFPEKTFSFARIRWR